MLMMARTKLRKPNVAPVQLPFFAAQGIPAGSLFCLLANQVSFDQALFDWVSMCANCIQKIETQSIDQFERVAASRIEYLALQGALKAFGHGPKLRSPHSI